MNLLSLYKVCTCWVSADTTWCETSTSLGRLLRKEVVVWICWQESKQLGLAIKSGTPTLMGSEHVVWSLDPSFYRITVNAENQQNSGCATMQRRIAPIRHDWHFPHTWTVSHHGTYSPSDLRLSRSCSEHQQFTQLLDSSSSRMEERAKAISNKQRSKAPTSRGLSSNPQNFAVKWVVSVAGILQWQHQNIGKRWKKLVV